MEVVKKLFPLRTCTLNLSEENISTGKLKVCLDYQIGICKGPCEGHQSLENYNESIQQIRHILKGNYAPVLNYLKEQLALSIESLAFELSAQWQQKLELLQNFTEKSTIVHPNIHEVDVFNYYAYNNYCFVNYLKIVRGTIIQTHTVEFKSKVEEEESDLLLLALTDIREKFNSTSREIIVPLDIDLDGGTLKFIHPIKGDKKKLLDLSKKNAMSYAQQKLKAIELKNPQKRTLELMKRMQSDLELDKLPYHIECFDNSNIQGTHPVAACVVFKDGKPSKKEYRHYNIKTVEGPDDFASMEEVVFRRYRRLLEEKQPLPQLIVIDGGKGQLSSALKSLDALGLRGKIAIIGIAKRLEEIYYPGDSVPLYLDKKSESLKIIQFLRNEAHRFGITLHRNKRSKSAIQSELEQIPDIGKQTITNLLRKFKSAKRVKEATLEELKEVVGFSRAQKVYQFYQKEKE